MTSYDGGGDGELSDAATELGYEVVAPNCSSVFCNDTKSTQQIYIYAIVDTVNADGTFFEELPHWCQAIDMRDIGITQRFAWWTYTAPLNLSCMRVQYTGTYTGLIGNDWCTSPAVDGTIDPEYYNQDLRQTWHLYCTNHCVWGVNETRNYWRDSSGTWRLQGNPANTCPGQTGCPFLGGSDGSPLWYWFKKPGQDNNGGEFYWCLYQTYPQVNGQNVCNLGS